MSPRLDPQAQALLEVMRAGGMPQPYEVPLEQAREQMRAVLIAKGQQQPLHAVDDVRVPSPAGSLAMRLYRPAPGTLPIALFLHGGGWLVNDLDTHDRLCRRLAARSGWLFAALEYRRAPEHRHPAALQDALHAYRWLRDNAAIVNGDPARVALFGESSGATTAACLALLVRDLGAPAPVLQVLAYPLADMGEHWPSCREHASGYTLDMNFVRWSLENYLPPGYDRSDPYLVPLASEDLSRLPPALIVTAEFDPLRDGAIAYARKLAGAGVTVEHVHAEDQMHGFLLLDRAVARAGALIDRLGDALAARAGVTAAQPEAAGSPAAPVPRSRMR